MIVAAAIQALSCSPMCVSSTEQAIAFAVGPDTLAGIIHPPAVPDGPAARTGVVVVVGGPQYRGGSHRQFVHLARHLAAAGHPVLRFDVRGMGDSTGAQRSFEALTPDIGAAIGALQQHQPQVERVVLWGLCDGASAALLYLDETADLRVAGLALANPWVRSAQTLARTQVRHYYRQRVMQSAFWLKLLRGGVAGEALRSFLGSVRLARQSPQGPAQTFQQRMAAAWRAFDGPICLIMSGRDYTAKEFLDLAATSPVWLGLQTREGVEVQHLPEADHTLSDPDQKQRAHDLTLQFCRRVSLRGTL